VLVTLQSSLPDLFEDTRFTVGQPDHFPEIGLPSLLNNRNFGAAAFTLASLRAKAGSGSGSHTHLKKFMRLPSVPWSSFPQ